jgi:hypothetical protein
MLLVSSELYLPVLARERMPVQVGARLLPVPLPQQVDIGVLRVVLLLPLLLMLVVLMLRLLVGG